MMDNVSHSYYPAFLDINGRRCVVVGGGQVAFRKVKALLKYGARVDIISRDLCSELSQLVDNNTITLHRRSYRKGDLHGAFIVIAATNDNNTNNEIVNEARREHILVNTVDNVVDSDFITPAYLQRGNITVAISTAGSSPALARKIRTRLEKEFGEEYAALTLLVEEIRTELKLQQKMEINSDDWQKALNLDILLDLLKKGEKEKARLVLLDNLQTK